MVAKNVDKLVSIIVPIYNVEKYLERCISSLITQTYEKIEIILVDDGSNDASGKICDAWKSNSRIRVVHQSNAGVSTARNAGLSIATGEYIMFADPDDWLEPNMIETLVREIDDLDFVYCGLYINTDNDEKIVLNSKPSDIYSINEIYSSLFFGINNSHGKTMSASLFRGLFKKEIIDRESIKFDSYIRYAEDWLFYAAYFMYISSMKVIDIPLYHYYQRNSSLTHTYRQPTELGIEKSIYILDKFSERFYQTSIDHSCCSSYLIKRYLGVVFNASKNVWNKECLLKNSQKKDFILLALNKVQIENKLNKLDIKCLDYKSRIMYGIIRSKNIFLLSLYGIAYNIMKSIRDTLKS